MNTDFLDRCIRALEMVNAQLRQEDDSGDNTYYDVLRAACVKDYEIVLEQIGKLMRKRLRVFFASNRAVDELAFKDVFRYAAKHGLIGVDSAQRWLQYRDNRNKTAHDYGVRFAEQTLKLLPTFIADAKEASAVLKQAQSHD